MKKNIRKTKVIFRKFKKDGSIIAIFPEELSILSAEACWSYMRVGQHSPCIPVVITPVTDLAKEKEYRSLFEELESIGYNLEIKERNHPIYKRKRAQQLKKLLQNQDNTITTIEYGKLG